MATKQKFSLGGLNTEDFFNIPSPYYTVLNIKTEVKKKIMVRKQ